MYTRVAGANFRRNVSSIIPTTNKVLINFRVVENDLRVQVIGNTITETTVDILEKDSSEDVDITVQAKLSLTLIDKDADVFIEFQQDLVLIRQDQFEFQATREWEQRFDIPSCEGADWHELRSDEFNAVVQATKSLDAIARETKQPLSDVLFVNKVAYAVYNGEIICMSTNVDQDFAMTAETARNLNKLLDSTCQYTLNLDKGYVVVKSKYKVIYATVLIPNRHIVESIQAVTKDQRKAGTVCFETMREKTEVLGKLYKAGKVTLSIMANAFSVLVTDGKTTFSFGAQERPIVSIRLTTMHLVLFNRLFGVDCGDVNVYYGGNILCLQDHRLKLLVSGTLF